MADRRDPRFGGNMERANTGIPYPTGGRDVRFEGSLPLQYQYRDQGRTVVSDTEPAFTDMGRNRNVPFNVPFDDSRREQAIMNQYQRPTQQHPNPRMRGMGGGGGGLESLQSKVNLQEIMDKMPWMNPYRIIKGLESHGVEYADNDPFDPSRLGTGDPFNNQIFTDPFDPRRLGIEEEPFDPFNPPGWTEPEINDPFNNQVYAARGGLMSLRR